MDFLLQLKGLQLTSPIFFWIALGLAVLLVVTKLMRSNRQKGYVSVAELDGMYKKQVAKARFAVFVRTLSLALAISLAGIITAGPYSQTMQEISRTRTWEYVRTVVIALDSSSSMKAGSNSGGRNIFEMSRDQAIDFLKSQENIRAGLIFYSGWPMAWRRPTIEADTVALELASVRITYTSAETQYPLGRSHMPLFSGATNTPRALYLAEDIFRDLYIKEGIRGGAFILLTDLKDSLNEVEEAINALTKNGVRVYVLANTRDAVIDSFRNRTIKNPGVRVFDARSEGAMEAAYSQISRLESSPIIIEEIAASQERDLRMNFSLILFVFLAIFVVAGEFYLRPMRGGE